MVVGRETEVGEHSDVGTAPSGTASPISSLIEELLVMILEDVVASEPSLTDRSGSQPLSSPRNLARVSRAWRNIVFASPALWKYVHFTPVQSISALKEHIYNSSPFHIHLTVHPWPFPNPPASGPYSIVALTTQLESILLPQDEEAPVSHRVESITVNGRKYNFLDFVLRIWTGRGSKFPALRRVTLNGNTCASWSTKCFFDGKNAPRLERLELQNVVLHTYNLPSGIGSRLTTLVLAAPTHKRGPLVVPFTCFHRVVSSSPSLTKLELHGHVVGFEPSENIDGLEAIGVTQFTHIRELRVTGNVFSNARTAFILFYLVPSLRHLTVRGRACCDPLGSGTVALALQAIVHLPMKSGWPVVLSELETLVLECIGESGCDVWQPLCTKELELWMQWRESVANSRKQRNATGLRLQVLIDGMAMDDDEEDQYFDIEGLFDAAFT